MTARIPTRRRIDELVCEPEYLPKRQSKKLRPCLGRFGECSQETQDYIDAALRRAREDAGR